MSSKEQTHSHDTEGSKQRSPQPATENLDMLAQQQTYSNDAGILNTMVADTYDQKS